MPTNPWLELALFGLLWASLYAGSFHGRYLRRDELGWAAADAKNWSPVGKSLGCLFLLGLAAVTIAAAVQAVRTL